MVGGREMMKEHAQLEEGAVEQIYGSGSRTG